MKEKYKKPVESKVTYDNFTFNTKSYVDNDSIKVAESEVFIDNDKIASLSIKHGDFYPIWTFSEKVLSLPVLLSNIMEKGMGYLIDSINYHFTNGYGLEITAFFYAGDKTYNCILKDGRIVYGIVTIDNVDYHIILPDIKLKTFKGWSIRRIIKTHKKIDPIIVDKTVLDDIGNVYKISIQGTYIYISEDAYGEFVSYDYIQSTNFFETGNLIDPRIIVKAKLCGKSIKVSLDKNENLKYEFIEKID